LGSKKSIDFIILSLSNIELKYTLIEKNSFSLVKVAENFRHFIHGKHTKVKVPLPTIKFLLSQTFLLGNHAHYLTKVQEHDFEIFTSHTIKG
jgi:hypothetical protein